MSPLDYSPEHPDPSTVSPWPAILRYGLIGGLIFIFYSLIGNITGLGRPNAGLVALMVFGLAYFVIYIGLLVFSIKNHRDEDLGGFIDIKRSIWVGTGVALIAGVISSIFGYIYMTMIEPDMAANMMEEMVEMFENMGLEEEAYEDQLAGMEAKFDPMTALMQGIGYAPIIGLICSVIIGAILKKDRTEG